MSRTIITTAAAPRSPAYSQAVRAGGLIFVSGTSPIDPATGRIVEGPVQAQVAQCLRNISAILEAGGSDLHKAVSATLIVADEDNFAPASEEWSRWFASDPPARQGAKMPVRIQGMKVSIALIAEA
ncbi:MAG: Rid family hydrolase [Geminicoccaceae bacterium]